MEDTKIRMNLVAIKKVDPYAKEIVDSSSHVAFYTFNSDKYWEKTDVEGAFFIYRRNAQPYHSIFINNRLNTNSFVEPITMQMELQSQPPFLLYRNERSRIRGFWFYNSDECDRISNVVLSLVNSSANSNSTQTPSQQPINIQIMPNKPDNVNLFKMLSNAQKEYNNTQVEHAGSRLDNNVLEFFAAAKPAAGDKPIDLVNTLSVEQIENQQRINPPSRTKALPIFHQDSSSGLTNILSSSSNETQPPAATPLNGRTKTLPFFQQNSSGGVLKNTFDSNQTHTKSEPAQFNSELRKFFNSVDLKTCKPESSNLEQKLKGHDPQLGFLNPDSLVLSAKPALMPPTMFEKPAEGSNSTNHNKQNPLNASQLVQAFVYLLQTDEEFVHKLHDAYLQIFAKTVVDTMF